MKFSISLHTPNGDRYLVCVSPLIEQLRRELELPEENIEVCQIVLDRERGDNAREFDEFKTARAESTTPDRAVRKGCYSIDA